MHRFKAIDPTAATFSSKPFDNGTGVAFTVKDNAEGTDSTLTVSEVATRHIRRLVGSASDYLGKKVTGAVVSVPSDWSEDQKAALVTAAKDANLEILQLITEPIAAVLANESKNTDKTEDKIVVAAKLGGIRSDVAVVAIRGGMYMILSTVHDYSLGGAQLDEVLMEYFAKEFIKKHKTDPRSEERGLAKLKLECEAVKKALSIGTSANFSVESLAGGIDFATTVNRSRYELLASKVLSRFTRLVENAIVKADLDPLDVDEILLAGGTSHTPRIATNMSSFFPETTVVTAPSTSASTINPSELVARGAALQAFLIESFDAEDIEQSTHPAVTVTPHLVKTVGFELSKDVFHPLITAETPLPVRRTMNFTSSTDGGILLRLVEGEREIKVTKQDPPPKPEKGDDDDDDEDDDEDEEPEEIREKVYKVGAQLGEIALKDVKKGSKITVQVQISADLGVTLSAQEIGKTGVRGTIPGSGAANGAAH